MIFKTISLVEDIDLLYRFFKKPFPILQSLLVIGLKN